MHLFYPHVDRYNIGLFVFTLTVQRVTRSYIALYKNTLRAKLFIENIKMHIQFISFLHTDITQGVETFHQVRQELNYYT